MATNPNENPELIENFCSDGTKDEIPEFLKVSGYTPENPNPNGYVLNKIFNQIFQQLNHQKQKGFSFWESTKTYTNATNNIDLVRRNNKIYYAKSNNTNKTPENNPNDWGLMFDFDNPNETLFSDINHNHDTKYLKLLGGILSGDLSVEYEDGKATLRYFGLDFSRDSSYIRPTSLNKTLNIGDVSASIWNLINLNTNSLKKNGVLIPTIDEILGINQNWISFAVGSDREAKTVYTNQENKPIQLSVYGYTDGQVSLEVDGVVVQSVNSGGSGYDVLINVIVPAGSTYEYTGDSSTLKRWVELR